MKLFFFYIIRWIKLFLKIFWFFKILNFIYASNNYGSLALQKFEDIWLDGRGSSVERARRCGVNRRAYKSCAELGVFILDKFMTLRVGLERGFQSFQGVSFKVVRSDWGWKRFVGGVSISLRSLIVRWIGADLHSKFYSFHSTV